MNLVLIGGNPKGYSIPFHPSTLSGRRLRNILSKLQIPCEMSFEIIDMTINENDIPNIDEINELKEKCRNSIVVFLGRFVEKELSKHIPYGIYLPHPASRKTSDLKRLETGLAEIINRVCVS